MSWHEIHKSHTFKYYIFTSHYRSIAQCHSTTKNIYTISNIIRPSGMWKIRTQTWCMCSLLFLLKLSNESIHLMSTSILPTLTKANLSFTESTLLQESLKAVGKMFVCERVYTNGYVHESLMVCYRTMSMQLADHIHSNIFITPTY